MLHRGSAFLSQATEHVTEPASSFAVRLKSISWACDEDSHANSVAGCGARPVRDGTDRDASGIEEAIRTGIDSIKGEEITEVE